MAVKECPAPFVAPVEPAFPAEPDFSPTEPAPNSPLRKSPRPGHSPNPSTDPRQFGDILMSRYFGAVPGHLEPIATHASPFRETGLPQEIVTRAMREEMDAFSNMPHPVMSDENLALVSDVETIQAGHEKEIMQCINDYLLELYGPECGRVLGRTEIEFTASDPGAVREILERLNDENPAGQSPDNISRESMEYCIATVKRAELYSLLVQGFSIIYMKDFLEWAHERFEKVSPGLYEAYRKFYFVSRASHYVLFRGQLETGINPLGPNHSMGESDVCYEPEVDAALPDDIVAMNACGRATSANGLVLAHEALKASIQLLTVWAKRYDNYCSKNEWLALRLLVNSPQAEIRQFALGPAVFSCMQAGLSKLGIAASPGNPDFYLFLQEWIGGDDEMFSLTTKRIFCDI